MAKAKPIRGISRKTPLLAASERMIGIRLDEMLAFSGDLFNPEAVYELHQMRIAAKRLRYTLELFQPTYDAFSGIGPSVQRATGEAEQIQEALGAIHDADMLAPQLSEYLVSLAKAGYKAERKGEPAMGVHLLNDKACTGLLAVCRRRRIERDKRYEQFLQHWRRLEEQEFFETLRGQLHEAAQAMGNGGPSAAMHSRRGASSRGRQSARPSSRKNGRKARTPVGARKRV
ncbi:MAG: hypothetical protein JWL77_5594 [Chthonomonadaceae bacterium]|nr:hypothetical protein [Chthonomonadaceae bacterium]